MRQIEFRAWEPLNKKMHYFDSFAPFNLVRADLEMAIGSHYQLRKRIVTMNLDVIELMQFTGCLDKNGKKVFHKDICKHDSFYIGDYRTASGVGIVEWVDDGWALVNKENEFICGLWSLFTNYGGEIIGNIWENGDLYNQVEGGER